MKTVSNHNYLSFSALYICLFFLDTSFFFFVFVSFHGHADLFILFPLYMCVCVYALQRNIVINFVLGGGSLAQAVGNTKCTYFVLAVFIILIMLETLSLGKTN